MHHTVRHIFFDNSKMTFLNSEKHFLQRRHLIHSDIIDRGKYSSFFSFFHKSSLFLLVFRFTEIYIITKSSAFSYSKLSKFKINHNRTVFEEMKSWTALTWYIEMKTAFKTKQIFFGLLLWGFKILEWRKYSAIQQRTGIGF